MYELPSPLEAAEVDPGTNVLIAGPPLTGKRQLSLEILASGVERGDGSIIVTTKDSAEKILTALTDRVDGVDDSSIGVVDCVTRQRGVKPETHPQIKYASSPVDMTGIGIKLSEFIQEFYETRGRTENRILLHSISTLLMYSDLQTVFRFLHVFTGRIQSANGLGVYVIDSTSHDEQTMNTLTQLFDAIVEVDGEDGSEPTFRTTDVSL